MTLVEYVASLQDQGLSSEDIFAKAQEFKEKNKTEEVEVKTIETPEVKEVKIEGVAETTDATVPPKTPDASETPFSDAIYGNGDSQYQEGDFNKIHENVFGKSIKEFEKEQKQYRQDQINSILKEHKPGTPERTIAYYQLELAPDDTINKDLYGAYDKYQKEKKEGEQFSDFFTRTQQEALEIAEKQRKEKIAKMTTAEQAEAVFLNNIPIQLEQQWEDTKAVFVNWISSVAGSDAADFLVGKMPDESIVFVDPETNEEVDFDENPEKWKELNTRNIGAEEIKTKYKGTDTNVGKFAEDYIIERFKESEELGKGIIDVGNIVDKFNLKDGVDIEFTSGRELFGGILNAVGSTVSTVIPAALTRGASLFPQVAAPMYVDYNVQKAKSLYGDDPEALDKLVRNKQVEVVTPLALGGVAVGLEYVGFKGIMKNLIGKTNLLKPLTTMVLTQNREGLTEVGQAVTEKVNEGLGKGKGITVALTDAITDPRNAKEYLENYMMGVVGSGVMTAPTSLGRSVNSALITETEVFNNATKLIQEVSNLQLQKSQSGNKAFKEAIDLQIQEKEQSLKDLLENTNKLTNLMTKEEQTEVLDLLSQKKKNNETLIELNESLSKGEITAQQYGSAKGGISSSNKALTNKVDRVLANANKRLIEGEVAAIEDIAGKENVETFDTIDDFVEATGQDGEVDAFIDESGKIFINKQRAAEVGAITAGSHELLHRILRSTFQADTNAALKLVDSFKNILSEKERAAIDKRIEENYKDATAEVKAEEYLTAFSDAIGKGEITYKDNLKETFMRLAKPILDIFRPKGYNKLNFKDGRDVYNFIKDYQKNIKKGKISERAQKLQDLGEVDLGTVKKSTTKRVYQKVESMKEDLVNPETKMTTAFMIANDPSMINEIDRRLKFEADEATREDVIRNFLFDDKRGLVGLLQGYDPSKNESIMGYLNSSTPGGKLLDIRLFEFFKDDPRYERIVQSETQEGVTEKMQRQTAETQETISETKEKPIAKKPTETVKYSDAIIEKAGVKDKAELEAKITEATKESFKDVDVERFGQTKDVPPAVAEIYGNMLGLNPETISDKTRTYQNYDEAGLNAAQRFLLANATNDFSRLPKTKDETTTTGRGTFIPKNMKDALYTDGRLTGTLKDYMDLIRSKPTGKLYRDSKYAQLIRGLLNTHIRNRMFEDLVPTTPERLRGGAMFSKTQSDLLGNPSTTQVQNLGKVISKLNAEELSNYMNDFDTFVDAIAVDDYNVEAAFDEVYGADFLTKKNGDPLAKKTDLINEWVKIRQSGKGVKDFSKQTPSEITMRDYLYQAFEEQTESEVVENILGIKKGGIDFRSKDQLMGYVNFMNNYIASKYGKLSDFEIADFVVNELGPTLSAGAKVGGNNYMWKADPNTGLLRLVPSTLKRSNSIRTSIFGNQRQMAEVLIKPFLSEANKNKLTYKDNTPLWEGKPLKKGQVSQKVDTYITSIKKTGGINKKLLDQSSEFAQQKVDTIVDILNWYKDQKSNKEITVDNLGMAFRAFNGDMTALVRAAARVDSFAGDGTGPQRYEHNPPARTMLVRMAEYVNGDITEQQLRDYFSNYAVSIIPELMDDVINERYKDTSPLIGSRYYNAFTYGRFPFAMTKYTKQEDGSYEKTIIGEYQKEAYKNANKIKKANIGMAPKALMSKTSTNEQIINDLGVFDNALNEARRPDAPVKKIRVFDFDDTLARSKSQVLYTVPNVEGGFSEGATKLKAIFMVGGPGAGKTNVGKGLQLGRRGYKVVNQDIALEAMKAEAGLPAKESDYTAEQRSLRSKLGAAARKAAVAKFDKYAAAGDGMVIDGTGASYNATTKKIKALQDAGYEVHMVVATTPLETAIERNKARAERSLPDFVVEKTYNQVQESLAKYKKDFGDRLYEINTETIEYGKPLPNDFLQQVYAGINANKVGKLDATQFAEQASTLEAQGAKFNFDEFSKVVDGKKGPLFSVAEKIAAARGTDDIFILTARPADAAGPIQEFMKANGIDLKLENIVGLGDGTAAAKGRWIAGKAAEGYNDFYFADDAIKNVQAVKDVLSQVDVKSKVQQAKFSKTKAFDKVFNNIIEAKTGIESYKQFSAAKAKTVGASKGKFTFFTTPSAEDFLGLLYKTLGKGKVGDAQMAFYKENLLDPFNRAEMAISQAKVAAGRDYKALKKQFKGVPKTLEKETGISKYSYQHAIRTYIWDAQGIEVPGLSKRDQKRLTEFVKADPELQAFADQLVNIQKGKPYPKPDKDWTAGNITTDVISGINKVNRAEYLQEWQENVDIIFSEKNMNKLEAAFGAKYVEALKDSLRAMKSGSNRPLGGDRVSNAILDWLNNSVGAIMFLNTRSAILQTISAVNFINWGDNNILKAGKAFANQKQFWSDFLTLMNSDYLLERRDGLKINVSESEIADAVEGSDNKVKAAISYLLNKGFVFTRYADSFAIASGGATFYRNRIESLVEQGMDRKLAEQQAFEDFRLIAEENQQSSSPMRISQQQRSLIGRIVLQFGNTQLQYVRIQKRAVQDLVNGRGDWRANISKIVYYGAIQNLLFNALQSGLAWALFDEDEDDEQLTEANKEQKLERALNGAIDSQLKGLGIQGAVIAGVKNALLTIAEQTDKKSPKFEDALDDLLSIAPALGSKIRKLKSAARTVSWNRKEIKEKGFSMDNPAYLAGAQVISAVFNIPLDRAAMKMNNMRNILNPATENWQKVALALGWSGWDVGLPYFGLAKDKPVLTETEKQVKKLFDLNKSDQVKMLLDLGLTKKQIRALTKEQQRVDEIIKLQNKKKDGK
jgi:predicted kinase